MNDKYKIKRIANTKDNGEFDYYSVDVYLESDEGASFVCECGDWNNDTARYHAQLITSLLNAALIAAQRAA
jgi:hypothetical protein